jgi:predicted RNA-binding protein with PIN domain
MAYLIDGHNLIGQLPDISLRDPDDEARLVQKLIGLSARQSKRVVVVFDSGLPGGKSRMSTGQVEVIFASVGSSADDVMKERIKRVRDPGQWIVVSNDRAVLDAARARRMTTITSAEFAVQLRQSPAPKGKRPRSTDPGEADDVHVSSAEVEAWLEIFKSRGKPEK